MLRRFCAGEPLIPYPPLRHIVGAFCSYELLALYVPNKRIPTLTLLSHRYRDHWPGRLIIGVVAFALLHHICLERPSLLPGPPLV